MHPLSLVAISSCTLPSTFSFMIHSTLEQQKCILTSTIHLQLEYCIHHPPSTTVLHPHSTTVLQSRQPYAAVTIHIQLQYCIHHPHSTTVLHHPHSTTVLQS
jgi:hypothetical protein